MTKEELFNSNIGLAYSIANKYKINYSDILEDIYQSSLLGLWKSVRTFNSNYKIKFSSYASKVIFNEINQLLRKET